MKIIFGNSGTLNVDFLGLGSIPVEVDLDCWLIFLGQNGVHVVET